MLVWHASVRTPVTNLEDDGVGVNVELLYSLFTKGILGHADDRGIVLSLNRRKALQCDRFRGNDRSHGTVSEKKTETMLLQTPNQAP